MTNEQINIAIAELTGLDVIHDPAGPKDRSEAWKTGFFTPKAAKQRRISWPSSAVIKVVPDYCNDLNAMHEAEQTLWRMDWRFRDEFIDHLARVINPIHGYRMQEGIDLLDATAAQRAEAFVKTLGKWEEAK